MSADLASADPQTFFYRVFDRNAAVGKTRNHNVNEDTAYDLSRSEPTLMPEEHALVFLKDPAFRVVAPDGREIQALPASVVARDNTPTALEPDETVARLTELTTTALLARAVNRPGGHVFNSATKRSTLIDFLMNAPKVVDMPLAQRPRATGSEELPDALPKAATDKLLDGIDPLEGA